MGVGVGVRVDSDGDRGEVRIRGKGKSEDKSRNEASAKVERVKRERERERERERDHPRFVTHLVELGVIGFPDNSYVVTLSAVDPTVYAVGADVELAAREPPNVAWAGGEGR